MTDTFAAQPLPLDMRLVEPLIAAALAEDAPTGDITANLLIPADAELSVALAAREDGVLSGADVFTGVMHHVDPRTTVEFSVTDGQRFAAGDHLAVIRGNARAVLLAERVSLNLLQRMSGIATTTAAYVAAAGSARSFRGEPVRIVDTRKTTPGLRLLERYAVRCGGGYNHRNDLSAAVMAKDNHLSLLGTGEELTQQLRAAKARLGHTIHFEVEIDSLDQLDAVLAAGVDTIMLDNFSVAELRAGVERVAGAAYVEASGGITLDSIGQIASTGVDVISSGALTHSVRSLDLGLDALN
ncbi:carboxylating nicotinate-nucleotide diphosphorylase [Micrococcoides hystricis]|uniref:nicotinate-nucleotide diphosphorylase (carboxylating) n=1 Tax=Micrococcoides hystricis TaxID=1572761 RepID=A0ABV6PBX5_9MICC